MSECLFCRIIRGDIPSKKVYEDDDVYAFYDINPQAPVHVLVLPKKHIDTLADVATEADGDLMGKLVVAATVIAKELSLSDGYRVVINNGNHGGQEVYHIHVHLMGGRQMTWPPG